MHRAFSRFAGAVALASLALLPSVGLADWLQPDPSLREAQLYLRAAIRDTLHHSNEPARLDSLGSALLRVGRFDDARGVFERVLEITPDDHLAMALLGKIELFRGNLERAEALLGPASRIEESAQSDLFALRVRKGEYAKAAEMAPGLNMDGRVEMLVRMAEQGIYRVTAKKPVTEVRWKRANPVPLIRVKLNGERVLMAIDTGVSDLLIDDSAARRRNVAMLPSRSRATWAGSRVAVRNAFVQTIEIGDVAIENVPAGVLSLDKWSIEVNPRGQRVAGVIGLNVLRQFTPTMDYKRQRLTLRTSDAPFEPGFTAQRVPFEIWGENEMMVYGSLAGSRRMAFMIQTGVPGAGVGAPKEVMEEIGVKPGALSRLVRGVGQWLQGVPWSPVTVPTVTVGPIVQDKVPGWQGAMASSELWRHGVRRDALISHDFFQNLRVTIDWSASELIFEEP